MAATGSKPINAAQTLEALQVANDTQTACDPTESFVAGGKVMPLFEHLGELRSRLLLSVIALLVLFLLAFGFATPILHLLKRPLAAALPAGSQVLHFTGPLDVFITSLKVSFLTAVVLSAPVWLYQFWRFLEPALYPRERRLIFPFITASVGLFYLGISFCYFCVLPMALDFLIGLGMEVGTPIITITDYTSMLTLMIFGFGLVFETPLILVLLGVLGIVTPKTLATYRRAVIVGILFIAALLTPPDPLSQIGMAIPLYGMYEISILVLRFMAYRRSS